MELQTSNNKPKFKGKEFRPHVVSANERAARELSKTVQSYNVQMAATSQRIEYEEEQLGIFYKSLATRSASFNEADFKPELVGRQYWKKARIYVSSQALRESPLKRNTLSANFPNTKSDRSTVYTPSTAMDPYDLTPRSIRSGTAVPTSRQDMPFHSYNKSVPYGSRSQTPSLSRRQTRSYRVLKEKYTIKHDMAHDFFRQKMVYLKAAERVNSRWLNMRIRKFVASQKGFAADQQQIARKAAPPINIATCFKKKSATFVTEI